MNINKFATSIQMNAHHEFVTLDVVMDQVRIFDIALGKFAMHEAISSAQIEFLL